MKKCVFVIAIVLSALIGSLAIAEGAAPTTLFSAQQPGAVVAAPFRVITLPKLVVNQFSFVSDEGKTVLKIESLKSAGSLGVPLPTNRDTGKTKLSWTWKINRALERAAMETKEGDDFAARVYVFFDVPLSSLSFMARSKIRLARMVAGADVPTAALCYVWDNKYSNEHRQWSPYTDRVRMIVLRGAADRVGQWHSESRDVAADFREAFGFDMPPVTGVAVGNDTDQTGENVTTWFGDIAFR